MEKLQRYTLMGACTPAGQMAPQCPAGWESVGYTQPGSCTIGNTPGDGPTDSWRVAGYQRVCKRTVPTSGDLAVDCCSNLHGISGSLECSSAAWKPYSWDCNNVMQKKCNSNVQQDPYSHNWDGMPYGQGFPVQNRCSGNIKTGGTPAKRGQIDGWCQNYLRNAPANNFFYNHDFEDYPYNFPRHSYTMPQFADTWGYQPLRTPYRPYHEWEWKDHNNYCRQFPKECGYGWPNDVRY